MLSGISVGSAVRQRNHKELARVLNVDTHEHHSYHFDIVAVLFLAFAWETVEHYLEVGLAGHAVEYWFQGVEFWGNRIITDPALMVCGYLIAKKYPRLVWPARALSIMWLFVHVFVFPHSMYLQQFLPSF